MILHLNKQTNKQNSVKEEERKKDPTLERFPENWQELFYSLKNQNISPFYVFFFTSEEIRMAMCGRDCGEREIPRLLFLTCHVQSSL